MSGPDGSVASVTLQPDGKVLIAGGFTMVNGVSRTRIARLNSDGSLDTSFLSGMSGANAAVVSVALQPDGKVLIGGYFTEVNGVSRNRIARLNDDGSLDTTFLNGMTGADRNGVVSVALQPDGRVLVGGGFLSVNSVLSPFIARLYGDAPVRPDITIQPSNQTSYAGCCAMFRVTATGTPRDYRWRKNGVDLLDGGSVSGAASDTLTLTGVSPADEGAYSVVVSNVLGSETSNDISLIVPELPECRVAACDPLLGCALSSASDGTSCDDGNACTVAETCLSGECQASGEDADGDGIYDLCDDCPNSNVGLHVGVAGCDTGVPNTSFPDGCTLQDRINACGVGAENHGQFVSCVSDLANDLKEQGVLTGRQKGRIQRCAAQSNPHPAPEMIRVVTERP